MALNELILTAKLDLLSHEITSNGLLEDLLDNDLESIRETVFFFQLVRVPEALIFARSRIKRAMLLDLEFALMDLRRADIKLCTGGRGARHHNGNGEADRDNTPPPRRQIVPQSHECTPV
ncbi:MAG: hypothetical protein A49_10630 [Methyloceanibacter sp.]|nr:MAG: hypothetical protein A49_10630 [Methyloceanibacter sp.]